MNADPQPCLERTYIQDIHTQNAGACDIIYSITNVESKYCTCIQKLLSYEASTHREHMTSWCVVLLSVILFASLPNMFVSAESDLCFVHKFVRQQVYKVMDFSVLIFKDIQKFVSSAKTFIRKQTQQWPKFRLPMQIYLQRSVSIQSVYWGRGKAVLRMRIRIRL